MRVSTVMGDEGFAKNVYNLKVFLDEVEIRYAVIADEDQGYIEIIRHDDNGHVVLKEGGEFDTVKMYGSVKIEVPDGWMPIT